MDTRHQQTGDHAGTAKWALALAAGLSACSEVPPPSHVVQPLPAPTASESGAPVAAPEPTPTCPDEPPISVPPTPGSPLPPLLKMHPGVMKAYRVDACYWDTLAIDAARDSYLRSLAGASPSLHALPVFPRSSEPEAKVLYERAARTCSVALNLKDAPTPADAALAQFTPVVMSLAPDLAAATAYYDAQEYQNDGFEKGKELHARLVLGFEKLGKVRDALRTALKTYEKQRPDAACAKGDAERVAQGCFEIARSVMRAFEAGGRHDPALKGKLDQLQECTTAVNALKDTVEGRPWGVAMSPSFAGFYGRASQLASSPSGAPSAEVDPRTDLAAWFVRVVESRNRALSRTMVSSTAHPAQSP